MVLMYVLGIWDGHDSGAALLEGNRIIFASNEERFTGRKLEVSFPFNSINACIAYAGINPCDIDTVAFSTFEPTKTLSRIFPAQKERYYQFRRRKIPKPATEKMIRYSKYMMTSIGSAPFLQQINNVYMKRALSHIGIVAEEVIGIEHHKAHAATAAFPSGMKKALILTFDGLGDGLSSSTSILEDGEIKRVSSVGSKDSIGILYEQATTILGMRELEDEGKVMALSDYSFQFPFSENKLRDFIKVDGSSMKAKYGPVTQYQMLEKISWSTPREEFAYMVQQLLEVVISTFVENSINENGINKLGFSGGIMSNVKANMKIAEIKNLDDMFVFPHMGDGGLALGAAMQANYEMNGVTSYRFNNVYLGSGFSDEEIERALREEKGISYQRSKDIAGEAADAVYDYGYALWFQGRAEFGPRALGNRSIVARPDSEEVKEKLNVQIKRREWYQPFAPTILEEDAEEILDDTKIKDRFMTMAYKVNREYSGRLGSVMHVDNTVRAQILGDENKPYRKLITEVKKKTGIGAVLNTSLNIHGMPIVNSPEDALEMMRKSRTRRLFIGNYSVERVD
ncbi:hypothetical protein M1394_03295 [Candidatus Marsarchaeota archaeon]|nr:hypothetical protein [Candidatus Marsarchaeota archaeon]